MKPPTFWGIVEDNDMYRDVVAPAVAAEDAITRSTVNFIETRNMRAADPAAVDDIYMDLEKHLSYKYKISFEVSALVIELCQQAVRTGDFERE